MTARPLDGRWLAAAVLATVVCAGSFALSWSVTSQEVRQVLAAVGWLAGIAAPVLAVRAGVDAGVHKQRVRIH